MGVDEATGMGYFLLYWRDVLQVYCRVELSDPGIWQNQNTWNDFGSWSHTPTTPAASIVRMDRSWGGRDGNYGFWTGLCNLIDQVIQLELWRNWIDVWSCQHLVGPKAPSLLPFGFGLFWGGSRFRFTFSCMKQNSMLEAPLEGRSLRYNNIAIII